jgi:flagellar biosynthesis/type III secretory pathway protein FliH
LSNYDRLYDGPAKLPKGLEVEDFKEEVFTRVDDAEPIPDPNYNFDDDRPDRGPYPDPFEEFEVDRRPLSKLMEDVPSLDALFKPFDLEAENPMAASYADMYEYSKPSEYIYEDMDLRDPDVVKTLKRANEIFQQKAKEAEENAARIMEAAQTEAKGLVLDAESEAQNRAENIIDEAKQAAEALAAQAAANLAEAEAFLAKAKVNDSEAEEKLATAGVRIAGLDTEKERLEAEFSARKAALEKDLSGKTAEIEATRQEIWEKAKSTATAQGLAEGTARGEAEGSQRAYSEASKSFNEKVAGFLPIMEKMENLYNDLWQANGPMMVQLAIEAAEQILNKQLQEANDLTVRAFEACIDYLSQAGKVTFLARPEDIAALEEAKAEYRHRLGALVTISFKPEESLGPGDLIMESDVGRIDATVKYRTTQVLEVLRQAFAENSAKPFEVKQEETPEEDFQEEVPQEEEVQPEDETAAAEPKNL